MKIVNSISKAANWTTSKAGSALKLGAGVTGDVVATTTGVVGGTIAVAGGVVASVGFVAYAGGMTIMGASEKLSVKSQDMADRAYDDLVGKKAEEGAAPEAPTHAHMPTLVQA